MELFEDALRRTKHNVCTNSVSLSSEWVTYKSALHFWFMTQIRRTEIRLMPAATCCVCHDVLLDDLTAFHCGHVIHSACFSVLQRLGSGCPFRCAGPRDGIRLFNLSYCACECTTAGSTNTSAAVAEPTVAEPVPAAADAPAVVIDDCDADGEAVAPVVLLPPIEPVERRLAFLEHRIAALGASREADLARVVEVEANMAATRDACEAEVASERSKAARAKAEAADAVAAMHRAHEVAERRARELREATSALDDLQRRLMPQRNALADMERRAEQAARLAEDGLARAANLERENAALRLLRRAQDELVEPPLQPIKRRRSSGEDGVEIDAAAVVSDGGVGHERLSQPSAAALAATAAGASRRSRVLGNIGGAAAAAAASSTRRPVVAAASARAAARSASGGRPSDSDDAQPASPPRAALPARLVAEVARADAAARAARAAAIASEVAAGGPRAADRRVVVSNLRAAGPKLAAEAAALLTFGSNVVSTSESAAAPWGQAAVQALRQRSSAPPTATYGDPLVPPRARFIGRADLAGGLESYAAPTW